MIGGLFFLGNVTDSLPASELGKILICFLPAPEFQSL
jgi:hypothetical protein